MASWLASQLQKAENLLEAVDRTVSSASSQQFKGLDSGAQNRSNTDASNSYSRLLSGPFGGSTASESPGYGSPSSASSRQSHAATASSSPRPFVAAAPAAVQTAKQQQPSGQAAAASTVQLPSTFTEPGHGSAAVPAGPPPPAGQTASQPTSTGSYTVRTHGPFSPSPVKQAGPQQQGSQQQLLKPIAPLQGASQQQLLQVPAPPAPTAFGSWGPPPPTAAVPAAPAAAGPAGKVPLVSSDTESRNGVATPHTLAAAPAPSPQSGEGTPQHFPAAVVPATAVETLPGGAAAMPSTKQSPLQQVSAGAAEAPTLSNGTTVSVAQAEAETHMDTAVVAAAEPPAAVSSSSDGSSNQKIRGQKPAQSAPAADVVAAALQAALHEHQQERQHHSPADVHVAATSTPTQQLNGMEGVSAAAAVTHLGAASNPGPAGGDPQLMRLVETLRKRLDQVKAENQQLEDLLHTAEQATAAEQQQVQQLEAELASMHRAQDEIVSSAAANAAAQDAKIAQLQQDLEASNRQVVALQGALEAIQEQHQQVLSSKDSIEGGALEAVRSELASAESQLEFERRAHAATKAAATSRERDLEEQLASSSAALAHTQRQMDDLAARSRELEEQQAVAVAEASRLREQVHHLSQQQTAVQQPDSAHQLQLEAEKEALTLRLTEAQAAVLTATQAQRAAEAESAALQQEIAHIHSSYQASAAAARGPPQLEQQLAELQELLYQKQQQLERLSGEKQGQMLLLERQVQMLKSELGKAHAAAAAAQVSSTARGGHDIIPMDALGEPYQRLARHRKLGGAVQATANFLDRTAASAAQLLRQQPLARLLVFVYIVLIHLYVYFLLARMQRQAVMMLAAQDKSTAGHDPAHQLPGTH